MYIAYSDMEAFFGNYHHIAKVLDSSSQDTKRACLLSIALEGRVLMFCGLTQNGGLLFKLADESMPMHNTEIIIESGSARALHAVFDKRIGIISEYKRHTLHTTNGHHTGLEPLLDKDMSKSFLGHLFRVKDVTPTHRLLNTDRFALSSSTQEDCYRWIENELYHERYDNVLGCVCKDHSCKLIEL